ncbi:SGNH/GDSL hydrolase family protein [Eubacterium ruminantium]|uniref:SGNH/GDSL hydrolase family protein n=1 Tax=Eubacterium ruminantium TaxID=42322 RepID=UPI001567D316|nr:SGNH/GDSL hydrolase family protein [Eubacterium ruminantium]
MKVRKMLLGSMIIMSAFAGRNAYAKENGTNNTTNKNISIDSFGNDFSVLNDSSEVTTGENTGENTEVTYEEGTTEEPEPEVIIPERQFVENPNIKISGERSFIFIGDSYQYGVLGADRSYSWLDYLIRNHRNEIKDLYRNEVGGYGFTKNGHKYITLLKQLEPVVKKPKAITDIVTIAGYNDRCDIDLIYANMRSYVNYIRKTYPNARIWVFPVEWTETESKMESIIKAQNEIIRSAKKLNILVCTDNNEVLKNGKFCSDGFHPNVDGQIALERLFVKALGLNAKKNPKSNPANGLTYIERIDKNGLAYYIKGIFNGKYTGVSTYKETKYYVINGLVDYSYTGVVKDKTSNKYICVVKGKVSKTATGLYKGTVNKKSGWWYCKNGSVDLKYTGLAKNENGWWYCKNGKVDFKYEGVAKNEYGWWYCKGGKVDFSYTGLGHNEYGWWYCKGGKVDFSYKGIAKNEYGWWYCKGGKVDFSYTGLGQNENGWWYCKGGKVDFNYTGIAKNENGWWYCKNGKLDFSYTGLGQNENGWWYCKNGKVDFSFVGPVKRESVWWYCIGGKVRFDFNGTIKYKGLPFKVSGGKIVF